MGDIISLSSCIVITLDTFSGGQYGKATSTVEWAERGRGCGGGATPSTPRERRGRTPRWASRRSTPQACVRACGLVNGRVRVDSGPQWRHLRDEGRRCRWCRRRRQARRRRRRAQRWHPEAEASRQEVTIHQLTTAPLLAAASAPRHGLLCSVCYRAAFRCGTHLWKCGMVLTVLLSNK